MSSVTGRSLNKTDMCNSGNVQAGFGKGDLEIEKEIGASDRGLGLNNN